VLCLPEPADIVDAELEHTQQIHHKVEGTIGNGMWQVLSSKSR
jgi:hypothetical protein